MIGPASSRFSWCAVGDYLRGAPMMPLPATDYDGREESLECVSAPKARRLGLEVSLCRRQRRSASELQADVTRYSL